MKASLDASIAAAQSDINNAESIAKARIDQLVKNKEMQI
jgi:hypothetical protein